MMARRAPDDGEGRTGTDAVGIAPAGMFHGNVIAALHGKCFDEAWSPFTVRQVMNMPGAYGLIAVVPDTGGAADGTAGGGPERDLAGFVLARVAADECEILSLAVADGWRDRGIGRRLLDAAVDRAVSAGAVSVFLEVAEDNVIAQRLYRARGFRVVGRRADYYRRADGGRVAALTLALDTGPAAE
jgi:ribosomal-protein-alanine N-acetyltransferase